MDKRYISLIVDKYDPTSLIVYLNKLKKGIKGFKNNWRIFINGGGIDYGIFLNIDIENHEIEICNQNRYGSSDGYNAEDNIDEVLDIIAERR